MKTMILGLALSLMSGVALAQTPPASPAQTGPTTLPGPAAPPPPTPTPPAAGPQAQNAPQPGGLTPPPSAATPPAGGPQAQNAPPPGGLDRGPPEGEIIETPQGFFLVRPGNPGAMQLQPPQLGAADGDAPMMGDDGMGGGMDQGGMRPPRPRRGPPRMPEGKGARLDIHTPNLNINVKCPDDEPIKACIDAVSQLLDKTNTH